VWINTKKVVFLEAKSSSTMYHDLMKNVVYNQAQVSSRIGVKIQSTRRDQSQVETNFAAGMFVDISKLVPSILA
jgi:hypothetical protein